MLFAITDEVWKYLIDHAPAIIAACFAGYALVMAKRADERKQNAKDRNLLGNVAGALRDRANIAAKKGDLVENVGGVMVLTPRGREVVEPVREIVLDYYRHSAQDRRTAELFWELHQVFGPIVLEKICLPNNLAHLECYSALVALCRETQFVSKPGKPPSWRPGETPEVTRKDAN